MIPSAATVVVVVKVRVAVVPVAPFMRAPGAISIPALVTAPIVPEGAPAETAVSESVVTVMPVARPAVATPNVMPASVTETAVIVGIGPAAVVMTKEVAPGTTQVAVTEDVKPARPTAAMSEHLGDVAKNPDG